MTLRFLPCELIIEAVPTDSSPTLRSTTVDYCRSCRFGTTGSYCAECAQRLPTSIAEDTKAVLLADFDYIAHLVNTSPRIDAGPTSELGQRPKTVCGSQVQRRYSMVSDERGLESPDVVSGRAKSIWCCCPWHRDIKTTVMDARTNVANPHRAESQEWIPVGCVDLGLH